MPWASTLDVRKGRWGGFVDVSYIKLEPDLDGPPIPPVTGLDLQLEQVMAKVAGYYRIIDQPRTTVDLLAGANYTWSKTEIGVSTVAGPATVTSEDSWFDPIIGIRGMHGLSDRIYLRAFAEIGGFGVGSDLSYQLGAGLGYKINDRFSVEAMYRFMSVDYEEDSFVYDLDTQGLFLGMGISF